MQKKVNYRQTNANLVYRHSSTVYKIKKNELKKILKMKIVWYDIGFLVSTFTNFEERFRFSRKNAG